MELTALIILFALLQLFWFGARVGIGRGKYGVEAPATSGHEIWERLNRVHQNTVEQTVIFVPATALFAVFVSSRWVVLPGLLYLIGRQLYAWEYVNDPKSRSPGMAITGLALAILLVGAIAGVVLDVL